ncbi:MAG: hypothetical protein ABIJ09_01720 [Pseudomonadota bacterium]
MARCANCHQHIHYGRYWWSLLGNAGRNARSRPKISPIITCGHCGQDNLQQVKFVALQFLLLVLGVFVLLVEAGDELRERPFLIAYFLGLYLVVEFLWWTLVARLKKLGE